MATTDHQVWVDCEITGLDIINDELIALAALVGMNAVVMDNARIGPRSFVSAAAFVKAGFECPEQSLVMGAPASVKRTLSDQEVAWKQAGTREYQQLARRCLEQMQVCEPLAEPEPGRPRISDSGLRPKGSGQ